MDRNKTSITLTADRVYDIFMYIHHNMVVEDEENSLPDQLMELRTVGRRRIIDSADLWERRAAWRMNGRVIQRRLTNSMLRSSMIDPTPDVGRLRSIVTPAILRSVVFQLSGKENKYMYSNLVRGGIAVASPGNSSFLFGRWQQQFVIACYGCGVSTPKSPFPLGIRDTHVIRPRKCTC